MACAPTDQATLDYEREEEALFRAVSGQEVAFDSCDLGTFEELKERVNEFRPHILHLTGHGVVRDGKGHFAFEKEDGTADLVPAEELRRFLAGSGVQCVFASGCQSGQAPREALAGVCQALVGAEVPLAVGWAASIADDLATNFARRFYGILKDGQQPVDRALCLARQEAWAACKERGDPSWTLPVLYSATSQSLIFDPDPQRPPELPIPPANGPGGSAGDEGGLRRALRGQAARAAAAPAGSEERRPAALAHHRPGRQRQEHPCYQAGQEA